MKRALLFVFWGQAGERYKETTQAYDTVQLIANVLVRQKAKLSVLGIQRVVLFLENTKDSRQEMTIRRPCGKNRISKGGVATLLQTGSKCLLRSESLVVHYIC